MEIVINGKIKNFPQKTSIQKLLLLLNLNPKNCLVEVNKLPIPKKNFQNYILAPQDQIELVRFIGGG